MNNDQRTMNLKNKYKSHFSRYKKAYNKMNGIDLTEELIQNKDQHQKELMIVRDSFAQMKNELKNMMNALIQLQHILTQKEIDHLIDDPDLTDLDKMKTAYLLAEIQYLGLDFEMTGNQQSQIKLKRIMEHDAPELQEILQNEIQHK